MSWSRFLAIASCLSMGHEADYPLSSAMRAWCILDESESELLAYRGFQVTIRDLAR